MAPTERSLCQPWGGAAAQEQRKNERFQINIAARCMHLMLRGVLELSAAAFFFILKYASAYPPADCEHNLIRQVMRNIVQFA